MTSPTVKFVCSGCGRSFRGSAARAALGTCKDCEQPLDLPKPPPYVPRGEAESETREQQPASPVPATAERELQTLETMGSIAAVTGLVLIVLSLAALWMSFRLSLDGGVWGALTWLSGFVSLALSGLAAVTSAKAIDLMIRLERKIDALGSANSNTPR